MLKNYRTYKRIYREHAEKERKKYGQFFTSMETARFMSGLYNFDEKTGKVSVLDAGAGQVYYHVLLLSE